MQALFGDAEATRMRDLLRQEGMMAADGNRVVGNSATAERKGADLAMPVRAPGGRALTATGFGALGTAGIGALAATGQLSWKAAAGVGAATALSAGWNKLARTLELNRDTQFARLATARGQGAQDIWTNMGNPASPFRALMRGAAVPAVSQLSDFIPQ